MFFIRASPHAIWCSEIARRTQNFEFGNFILNVIGTGVSIVRILKKLHSGQGSLLIIKYHITEPCLKLHRVVIIDNRVPKEENSCDREK